MAAIRILHVGRADGGALSWDVALSALGARVTRCTGVARQQDFAGVDVVLVAAGTALDPGGAAALRGFVNSGGGAVLLNEGADLPGVGRGPRLQGPREEATRILVRMIGGHWIGRRIEPFCMEAAWPSLRIEPPWQAVAAADWHGRDAVLAAAAAFGAGRVVVAAEPVAPVLHSVAAQWGAGSRLADWARLIARCLLWAAQRDDARTIRLGIVGYGGSFDMGKVHAGQIDATDGLAVSAICDVDPARVAQARRDFPQTPAYSELGRLLADGVCDAAVLVLPHHLHAPVAMQCLEAGVGVVCEKPLCLTVEEADRMIDAARQRGLLLTVYHNRRLDADFRLILEQVRSGAIGEPFETACGMNWLKHPGWWWRSDKAVSGGNLYDWGAHMIDWTLLLMNRPIDWVAGFFRKARWHDVTNEDHTQAVIRFADGAMSEVFFSYLAAAPRPAWRINGTAGAIVEEKLAQGFVTRWSDPTRVEYAADGASPARAAESLVEARLTYGPTAWGAFYANLADHLLCGEPLLVPAEEARRVIAVIRAAEESAQTGRPCAVAGG